MAKTNPRWKRKVPRRLLDHRGLRPRRGAEARRRGVGGLQSEGRGAAQRCESRRPRLRPAQVSSCKSQNEQRNKIAQLSRSLIYQLARLEKLIDGDKLLKPSKLVNE